MGASALAVAQQVLTHSPEATHRPAAPIFGYAEAQGALPGASPSTLQAAASTTSPAPTAPATAPAANGNLASSPAGNAAQNAGGPKVDETALRYFAQQGDQKRLRAEIARLRALYPNWVPPTNFNEPAQVGDPELDRMWKLYAAGKYGDVRSAIAARSAADPNWKPPADLIARLDAAEARQRIANSADAGQWGSVITLASQNPALLTCADVDTLWRVAEAFSRTNRNDRARDAYIYILKSCPNPPERLATMQKALALLPDDMVNGLLQYEHKDANGQGEFEAIRDDLARRRVGKAAEDPSITVSADDVKRVERLARDGQSADDALLAGWYLYRHNQPQDALDFFKLARERNDSPKAAEGYVRSLTALGRAQEAEPVAYEWHDRSDDNRKAYADVITALLTADPPVALNAETLAHMAPFVVQQKDAQGAQALGWYAYNGNQVATAEVWFTTALGWKPDDEPSAYGLALCAQQRRDTAKLDAMIRQWGATSPRIAALAPQATPAPRGRRGASAPSSSAPSSSAAAPSLETAHEVAVERRPARREPVQQASAQATVAPEPQQTGAATPSGGQCGSVSAESGKLSAQAALTQGWCLMQLSRPMEAIAAFDVAMRTGSGQTAQDAAYGKSLAYLRKGLTSEAAVAASAVPLQGNRGTELSVAIITQRALSAYQDGRYNEAIIALQNRAQYAPEQNDLLMVRGWSYYHLGRYRDAQKIFMAVAKTGYSTEALRGLNAIAQTTNRTR
ncbi:hypothetical protein SAMN05216548_11622 [Faunimonas pinastri]|uniref:Cellulose synthase n=2 Tax=Faunimonas pinastri TaxID=1855383 RepID=A0A1H9NHM7_9HYPH|nr:hypothetical protein SAMN05216548_11622 [Faunimonas pinastri]